MRFGFGFGVLHSHHDDSRYGVRQRAAAVCGQRVPGRNSGGGGHQLLVKSKLGYHGGHGGGHEEG